VLSNDDDFEEKQTKLKMILQSMQIGVERTSNIVKSLNSFSRKSTKDNGECDLHEIIDNCLIILKHEIIDKCKLTKNYCTEPYSLVASRENLHQVFLNIIKNAFQAIESEGVIEISTQLLKKQGKLEIVISDNGAGISPEHLEKIHDPFFTTKEAGEGVGLGLFIVFKIISEHNGQIKYESELNKGTTVKIVLPIQT
jgi:signal transduction histidine kinase